MITKVMLGPEIPAGAWTLVPVIRLQLFTGESWGTASGTPVGLIGFLEGAAWFLPLANGVKWDDLARELVPE